MSAGCGSMVTIVSFDGTKCCIERVGEGGEIIESKCFPCKTIKIKCVECVIEGYNERPGFVITCNGKVSIEDNIIVLSS